MSPAAIRRTDDQQWWWLHVRVSNNDRRWSWIMTTTNNNHIFTDPIAGNADTEPWQTWRRLLAGEQERVTGTTKLHTHTHTQTNTHTHTYMHTLKNIQRPLLPPPRLGRGNVLTRVSLSVSLLSVQLKKLLVDFHWATGRLWTVKAELV